MNQELLDNWNTIVLSITTRGGFMVERSSKRFLFIPESTINLLTDLPTTKFKEFQITSTEYKKILEEVLCLREELYLRDEELKLKKVETLRKRAETRARKRKESTNKITG